MHAYVIPGGNVGTATEDPRVARLLPAGPWQAQMHLEGAVIVPKPADGAPIRVEGAFGTPRQTKEGLIYLPPKTLPPIQSLRSHSSLNRDDLTEVRIVREEQVQIVGILPAYLSPRRVLDDNTRGDFSTKYGKAVRALLDRIAANPKMQYGEYAQDLFEACRFAIMYTHPRMTRELITEYDVLDDDTAFTMWEAMIHVPKESPGSVVG